MDGEDFTRLIDGLLDTFSDRTLELCGDVVLSDDPRTVSERITIISSTDESGRVTSDAVIEVVKLLPVLTEFQEAVVAKKNELVLERARQQAERVQLQTHMKKLEQELENLENNT